MSNLRVSVECQNEAIFAGEQLECVITFKNTAQFSSKSTAPPAHNHESARERWKDDTVANNLHNSVEHSHLRSSTTPFTKGYRKAASLKHLQSTTSTASGRGHKTNVRLAQQPGDRSHGRSVSIVSIGSDTTSTEHKSPGTSVSRRPGEGHGRAASLQFLPMRYTTSTKSPSSSPSPNPSVHPTGGPVSAKKHGQSSDNDRAVTAPAILRSVTSSTVGGSKAAHDSPTPKVNSVVNPVSSTPHNRTLSAGFMNSLGNPQISLSASKVSKQARDASCKDRSCGTAAALEDESTHIMDFPNSLARVFSSISNDGTPRSSTEKYSVSNNSSDTLASEYVNPKISQGMHQSIPRRQPFHPLPSKFHKFPEQLLMGYANITGVFTVDPLLVNTKSFDEVKRKAVIGNQGGGGVVRAEVTKRHSGLLGSLGWNALGESLGGLMGGSEVSSIKEKANDAKWIPLMSTPQSLLFIDLRLEPGQCQSYSYSHRLPLGLPPTYKGKAVRFSYNIVIGVQRATESAQRHIVRHFDFPFRVLPGVDGNGQTVSHDLMSPYVMLHSESVVSPINDFNKEVARSTTTVASKNGIHHPDEDFLFYVSHLLDAPRRASNIGLRSPSATGAKSPIDPVEESATVEDAISLAIQQSNSLGSSKLSANRYEIARSGHRVAVIMLARPAYRLGEVVPITIDFDKSELQCYSLRVSLETTERVDSAIALRSQASISRISRKVHSVRHDASISADRISFSLAIPNNATPEFKTSGVSLEWTLRCEFVTSKHVDTGEEFEEVLDGLLEQVAEDERGSVSAAVQAMSCEAFEVHLPLAVYGDPRGFDDSSRVKECPI
ncbi:MAG: hypothetical protein Q9188_000799 [Gyalolechia gomerana]